MRTRPKELNGLKKNSSLTCGRPILKPFPNVLNESRVVKLKCSLNGRQRIQNNLSVTLAGTALLSIQKLTQLIITINAVGTKL